MRTDSLQGDGAKNAPGNGRVWVLLRPFTRARVRPRTRRLKVMCWCAALREAGVVNRWLILPPRAWPNSFLYRPCVFAGSRARGAKESGARLPPALSGEGGTGNVTAAHLDFSPVLRKKGTRCSRLPDKVDLAGSAAALTREDRGLSPMPALRLLLSSLHFR